MDLDPKDKRTFVKGLSLDCPFCEALESCPLNAIRKLPVSQIIELIDKMPDEQIEQIIHYHQECSRKRTERGDV